ANSETRAFIGAATVVNAASLDVKATAETSKASTTADFVSVSIGGQGNGANVVAKLTGVVEAFVGGAGSVINTTGIGGVGVVAETADASATSDAKLSGGAIISASVALADASNTGSTTAYVRGGTVIGSVGNIEIKADSKDKVTATSHVAGG